MVAARKSLLRMVRRLAIRDELTTMRLRGRLVMPLSVLPATKPPGNGSLPVEKSSVYFFRRQ